MFVGVNPGFDPQPILLEGRHVRLEPLERRHLPALVAVARDPEVFQFFLTPPLGAEAEMSKWLEERLGGQATGAEVAWATVRVTDNRLVGATTFLDIRRANRGLDRELSEFMRIRKLSIFPDRGNRVTYVSGRNV